MSSIDERIVEMRMDSDQFERKAKSSLKILDALKKGLNMDGSAKSLSNLEKTANDFALNGMAKGIDVISKRFTTLGIVSDTVLRNMTTSALNTGKNLVKSLSVDNIASGWSKFEKKTSSVATLIAQGYDMATVEAQLNRLNWFTDETSYNFTEMVSSIAKFTASGQKLEPSVTALEGIANWAALSGQNAETASRAMYQISQAMGAGIMRKEDYKSIQNVSMDTEEFRRKALEAGVALGTLKKNADDTYTSLVNDNDSFSVSQFAEHLTKDAWFTSDVMMKVFNDYSAAVDQIYEYSEQKGITASQAIEELGGSIDAFGLKAFQAAQEAKTWTDVIDSVKDAVSTGWSKSFETVFGNYEEQKVFWTDLANSLYDIFMEGLSARNELLAGWKDMGGRDLLVDSFWNMWEGLETTIASVKDSLSDLFPVKTAEQLFDITEKINNFSKKFKVSDKSSVTGADWDKLVKEGVASEEFQNALKETAKAHGIAIDEMITDETSFRDSLEKGWLSLDILTETLHKYDGEVGTVVDNTADRLTALKDVVSKVILGDYGNGAKRVDALTQAGYDYAEVQNLVNKTMAGMEVSVEDLTDSQLEAVGATQEQIDSIRNLAKAAEESGTPINDLLKSFEQVTPFTKIVRTLGKAFKNVFTSIKNVIGAVGQSLKHLLPSFSGGQISDFVDAIYTLTEKLMITDDVADKLGRTFSGLTSVIGIITTVIGTGINIALKVFGSLLGNTNIGLLDVTASLGDSIVKFKGFVGKISEAVTSSKALSKILGALSSFFSTLRGIASYAAGAVKDFSLKIIGTISSSERLSKIVAVLKSFFEKLPSKILSTAQSLKSFIDKTAGSINISEKFSKIIEAISGFFKNLPQYFKMGLDIFKSIFGATEVKAFSDDIEDAEGSIENLSGTISSLEKSAGTFERIGKGIGEFASEVKTTLGPAAEKIKDFLGDLNFENLAHIAELGLYIGILYQARKLVKGLESTVEGIGGGFGKVAASISGAFNSISGAVKTWQKSVKADNLLKIAGAVLMLVAAIFALSRVDYEDLLKGISAIGIILIELGAFSKLADLEGLSKGGLSLVGIAATLALMGNAIKSLAGINAETLATGLVRIAILLTMLAGALRLMGPANIKGAASSFAAIATAVTLMIIPIKVLGEMDVDRLAQGLISIGVIMSALTTSLKIIKSTNVKGAASSIVGIAVALTMLLIPIKAFGKMDIATLKQGLMTVGAIMAAFAVSLRIIKNTDFKGASSALIGIAAAITVMMIPIVTFGKMDLGTLRQGIISVGVILGLFVGTCLGLNAAKAVISSAAKTLLTIAGVMAIIGITMAALAKAISCMEGVSSEDLLYIAAAMAVIVGVIAILGKIKIGMGAIKSVLEIAAVIGVIGAVIAAFGGLAQIPGLKWLVNEGGELLGSIGTVIGTFFGNIAGSFVGGVSSGFPAIGTNLSQFMENVQPFIEGAGKIDASVINGIGALSKAILCLTAADFLDGISSWLTGGSSLSDFASSLETVGAGIVAYCNVISGTDFSQVEASAKAIQALAGIDVENSGGVAGFFAGENNLSDFALGLTTVAIGISNYCNLINGTDFSQVEASAKAIQVLAGIDVENSGGVAGFFAGENDLDKFASSLETVGNGIKNYCSAISGISDYSGVEASAKAIQTLAEIDVENSGGVAGFFAGENDLDKFASGLETVGNGIKNYCSAISGISDYSGVETSAKAIQALANIKSENSGGVAGFFAGENDLDKFASGLETVGGGIKKYCSAISGISDYSGVEASVKAIQALANIDVENSGGVAGFFAGENDLDKFASGLETVGGGIKKYCSAISGINVSNVSASAKAIQALADVDIKNDSGKNLDTFASSLKTCYDELDGIDLSKFSYASSAFNSLSKAIESVGDVDTSGLETNLSTTLSSAADSGIESFGNSISTGLNNIATLLAHSGAGIGEKVVSGMIRGLNSGLQRVWTAAWNLGQQAVKGGQAGVDSHSPSKEFIKIGEFCSKGLAVGLGDSKMVARSAIELGQTALREIKNSLGIHSPSVVFKEEVGHYIVQGIAEGIDKDTSAEDAIAKKAQNIVNAFKTELDRLDLESSITELSYQLWEKSNPNASALEKGSKNAELLGVKIENQRTKKTLADDEYLTMVKTFGEWSKEARESREKVLKEESTLFDYEQELADNRNEQFKRENGVAEDQLQAEEDLADAKYEAWKNDYEATASYEEQAEKQRENLLVHQKTQNERVYQLSVEYQNIVDTLGDNSDEAKAKLAELTTATTSLKKIGKELADTTLYVAKKTKENAQSMQEISSLQQEYWEKSHTEATEQEKADKSIEFLNTEMQNKAIEFTSSLQEFYDILSKEGFSENARSALKGLYSLAVDSQELLNEADEAVKNADTAKKDAYKNYLKIRNENEVLKQFGYDEEFIDRQARELSGYNSDSSAEISPSNIENLKELLSAIPEFDKLVANSANTSIGDTISSILKQLSGVGLSAEVAAGIQNGITASVPGTAQPVAEIVQAGTEAIKSQQGAWNEAGIYLVEGFIAGIKSKIEAAAEAAASVARQAYRAAMSELEIHSPSKKFAKLGMFVDLGFVKGLERYSGRASSASSLMAEDTVNSFSAVIGRISDIINSDSGYEPTMRPVIDASSVEMGMRHINGILSTATLDMSAAANRAASISINTGSAQTDNRRLIQAVNDMSSRLDNSLNSLRESASKFVVKMDTGAVVGQLEAPLDASFGRSLVYKERGM